jgi:P-type Mg2+ transporter
MDRPQEVPISSLVPGDIIYLSAGDMIPADVRLLAAKDLFVSQAMLTGEAIPLEKHAVPPTKATEAADASQNVLERETACFMGTNVVSGTAVAVVAATGDATSFGAMAKDIVGARPLTSFDKGISKVSWMLIRFLMVMTPLVFLINGLDKGDWLQSLLFAVSVAVGLTPEMLPMIVTTNLAKGAVTMARRKTIVKRLNAIQNFGAMDILCTDKTGTLTQNKIILERHLNVHGKDDLQVLEFAWLNSSYQTGLKNLLDVAVLDYAMQYEIVEKLKHYRKIDELPFDFMRRRMSVVVRDGDNRNLMVCKGAIEEMLPLCVSADDNGGATGGVIPFTAEMRKEVRRVTRKLNQEGLRALAVGYKWLPPEDRTYTVEDEKDFVLAGYVASLIHPRTQRGRPSPPCANTVSSSRSLPAITRSSPARYARRWGFQSSMPCWARTSKNYLTRNLRKRPNLPPSLRKCRPCRNHVLSAHCKEQGTLLAISATASMMRRRLRMRT